MEEYHYPYLLTKNSSKVNNEINYGKKYKYILALVVIKNNVAVNFQYWNSFYNELIGTKENRLLNILPANI